MEKIAAYARLFRIEHALLLSLAAVLGALLSGSITSLPIAQVAALILVPALLEMGSFALNDWFDVKTDKENQRNDRPVASGEIGAGSALIASAICYAAGLGLSFLLPASALYVAILFALLSILYNWKLKLLPLAGNLFIAASMAIPFLFGNLVVSDSLYPPLVAIAAVAFVAGLGREIIKSAEDVEGDVKHRKARTLPALVGKKRACHMAALLYFLLVPLSFSPFYFGLSANIIAVGLVLLTALSFASMGVTVLKDSEKPQLEAMRKASLLSLAIGLLGYAASLLAF